MRSSHSSHRSHTSMSHRASMSHRSRSSFSSRLSSLSHRGSKLSSMSNHRSSLSSMSRHRSSLSGMNHRSSIRRRGISDSHAFNVGRATGVNINGSARGAHGAALGRFARMRRQMKTSSYNRSTFGKRKIRFSNSKVGSNSHYTLNKDLSFIKEEFEEAKYNGFFLFIIFFVIMVVMFIAFFLLIVNSFKTFRLF